MMVMMVTSKSASVSRPACENPSAETCLHEMLEGPPVWDDPQLLQVIKEEFLRPPVHVQDIPPILEGMEVEVLEAVNKTVGPVDFLVATVGVNLELVKELSKRATGIWIDPRPWQNQAPSVVSNMWHTHACLTPSIPYVNTRHEQCLSLASLLTALGSPRVDLVLAPGVKMNTVLHPMCDLYPQRPKAILFGRILQPDDIPEEFRHCTKSLVHVTGQYSLILLHSGSPSTSRQDL
ncbi:uncharacterized protein LOC119589056 [Penaeus monodon]|uniref:uncharacterized protein LOC119589056 n=1 Tax=Penaeus monodon TaxID=6687 RepID=UPI0018A793E8|nr:uncharacterized protein LOC119589056 [Penaeus monodon]